MKKAFKVSTLFLLLLIVICSVSVFSADKKTADFSSTVNGELYTQINSFEGYESYYTDQWWFGENYLDLANVKRKIQGMTFDEDKPVIIAVIDSGVNFNHEIFHDYNLSGEPDNDTSGSYEDIILRNSAGDVIGANTVNKNTLTDGEHIKDIAFHGTGVAGTIALLIRYLGLSKYIKIMPICAGYINNDDISFKSDAVERAVIFAVENGATVINLSLGSNVSAISKSNAESAYAFLKTASYNGATIVASAGNSGKNSRSSTCYPASITEVISVMAYDVNDNIASYSNYNEYDIIAPGSGITTSAYDQSVIDDDNTKTKYATVNGTSFSSPVVAFSAGLTKLLYPSFDYKKISALIVDNSKKTFDYSVIETYLLVGIEKSFSCPAIDLMTIVDGDYDGEDDYIFYDAPSSITLSCNDSVSVGKTISVSATVDSADTVSDNYMLDWYVNDVKVATLNHKQAFTYSNTKVGTYTVYAKHNKTSLSSNVKTFSVCNELTNITPLINTVTVTEQKQLSHVFSIVEYLPETASGDSLIDWYINGNFLSTAKISESVSYVTDNENGKLTVKAVVHDVSTVYSQYEYNYVKKISSVTIENIGGNIEQVLGSLSNIRFGVSATPIDFAENDVVEWYVDDVKIANIKHNLNFEFDLTMLSVGSYNVYAKYDGIESNVITVSINYAPVSAISIHVDGETNQTFDKLTSVKFSATLYPKEYVDTDLLKDVLWYVDGVLVDKNDVYYLTPTEAKSYSVQAKYSSFETDTVTVNVTYPEITAFSISTTGNLTQTLSTCENVIFTADYFPFEKTDPTTADNIFWYVDNVKQETVGVEFCFATEIVGTYEIKAELYEFSSVKTYVLNYDSVKSIRIETVNEKLSYYDTNPETLVFNAIVEPMEYVNPNAIADVVWYVDNSKKGKGEDYYFDYGEVGTYTVSASWGKYVSNNFSVEVIYDLTVPRKITLSSPNDTPTALTEIELNATVYPDNLGMDFEYIWTINDVLQQGTASSISFIPEKQGVYVIKANITEYDIPQTFTIHVLPYVIDYEIVNVEYHELPDGDKTDNVFSLNNIGNDEVSVIWYVNGQEKYKGNEFLFATEQAGDYNITVSLNGVMLDFSKDITVTAPPINSGAINSSGGISGDEPITDYSKLIVSVAIFVGVGALAVATPFIYKRRRKNVKQ